jgi:hydrogenase maturation protease
MRRASDPPRITILGVGNILLSDEGVGVRVVEYLDDRWQLPEQVRLVDGGVLGIGLMGLISETDILIVVDAVMDRKPPGTLCRLEGAQVPRRVLAKQSMHQMDLPEVLALSSAIGHEPQVIVIGIEPGDISTLALELTPTIAARVGDLADMVLAELGRLGVACTRKQKCPPGPAGLSPCCKKAP